MSLIDRKIAVDNRSRRYNPQVERLNCEGIPRHTLLFALKNRKQVMDARRIDSCLLCRNRRVNEAGLCESCYAVLDGEELRLVNRWMAGVGP